MDELTPLPADFADRYGPWAVVAGAGAGLGAAYVEQLIAGGLRVIAVDIDPSTLDALERRLPAGSIEPVVADLGISDDIGRILDVASARDVGLFVANAALSYVGWFVDQPLDSMLRQIDVNVRASVLLLHGLVPQLRKRDRSAIVLMSSMSARRGAPLVATYAATKAYLHELAESLWDELRVDGVDVMAVLPGSTRTPGWLASMPQQSMGTESVMDPAPVVAEALAAVGNGEPMLIPGDANRTSDEFMSGLPRSEAIDLIGQVMRATYPDDRRTDPTV